MRDLWRDVYTTNDILDTLCDDPYWSAYTFGSSVEGTTTVNMNPDIDEVFVVKTLPVMTECSDTQVEKTLLYIQDNDTPPGYGKLQLVKYGIPQIGNDCGAANAASFFPHPHFAPLTDKDNRLVCSYIPPLKPGQERHGPAIFTDLGALTSDVVCALNCSQWPDCAAEWLTRKRCNGWFSVSQLQTLKKLGFLLVSVGHPESDEQDLQWRLSFSKQERQLLLQFNSVQHKCYILLKLMKGEILPKIMGRDSLSSYHCKTCMLYAIENTSADLWRPANLLQCFALCLKLLHAWSSFGTCPNYFIPSENMFDKLSRDVQSKLCQTIHGMIQSGCTCLLQIQSNDIGQRLSSSLTSPIGDPLERSSVEQSKGMDKIYLIQRHTLFIGIDRQCFLQRCFKTDTGLLVTEIYKRIKKLRNTRTVTGHKEEQTKTTVSYLLPYLELHFTTNFIAVAKQEGRSREEIWQYLSSDRWHQLSLRSGISVKLKQATLMCMFGYYHASLDVLSSLEYNDRYSYCTCYNGYVLRPNNDQLSRNLPDEQRQSLEQSTKYIQNKLLSPCEAFLPTEREVTPVALCYEMMRFVGVPHDSTDNLRSDFLRHSAVVDGQFLFHFLLYLNHSKLNMTPNVAADTDSMEWMVNTKEISHRETCLNLLGWVYKDQGRVDRAVECFQTSLEYKPVANAAVLHLRDIDRYNSV